MSRAGLRVDLYQADRVRWPIGEDAFQMVSDWRWRLWSSSSVIAASSEGYVKRSAAIRNLEQVTGGRFEQVSTPDFPAPFGLLTRQAVDRDAVYTWQSIPVRLTS